MGYKRYVLVWACLCFFLGTRVDKRVVVIKFVIVTNVSFIGSLGR